MPVRNQLYQEQKEYCLSKGIPIFVYPSLCCHCCGIDLTQVLKDEAFKATYITGCPKCAMSFCD